LLARADERRSESSFVIEGATLLADALGAGANVEAVFIDAARLDAGEQTIVDEAHAAGADVYELRQGVLERVASTVTPQPVAAIVPRADVPLATLAPGGCVLVCVGVGDPGNLGAILRSAAASGCRAVVCCGGSVDPYNPKCVRASAGALLRVPVVVGGEPIPVLEQLRAQGWECLASVARGGISHTAADLSGSVALLLGNEARGLDADLDAAVDRSVTVEIADGAESLNVAMAATVLAFEARRQRQNRNGSAQ
jgi:TrmH family RNA methyltransferase